MKNKSMGLILIIDMMAIPSSYTLSKLLELINETGICYYDGSKGDKPKLIDLGADKRSKWKNLNFIDVSKEDNNSSILKPL